MTRRIGSVEVGPVQVGSVTLQNPVMTASGTAGYGVELSPYLDLGALGAVVTKSLAHFAWDGNPAPRLHPVTAGMLNAVGLQGPGVAAWIDGPAGELDEQGATVVASIWGRTVDDYRIAAEQLAVAPPCVVAIELNLSCPNLEGRSTMFAHDAELAADVVAATQACGLPRWAKLSANTERIVEIAGAVADAGAEAVTCINTMLGLAYDRETRRPALGAGGGGLSGPAIHPIATRAVRDVSAAHPTLAVIGVGGVHDGWTALELLLAGAVAVQVGTATFADPRAPRRVLDELTTMVRREGISLPTGGGALP